MQMAGRGMQVTPDLLAEAGYRYVMDFGTIDDQPVWMNTRSGKKLLAIPYAQVADCCQLTFPTFPQQLWCKVNLISIK